MQNKRTILIGDVHGCIDELNALLIKLSYDPINDRLIFLGDLIDRGPNSPAVIARARELNAECVMGNHEHAFLKWFRNNGTAMQHMHSAKHHYNQFSNEDINYIAQMPLYIKIDNYIIVHAGMRAHVSLQNQKKDDLMYLRYIDKDGDFISLHKIDKIGKDAAGAHFWTEFWQGPEHIIYGHNVHSYTDPLIEENIPGVICYGLDTGVCFGGRLTAMILETKEIVQVQAKKIYFEPGFNIK